MKWSSPIDVSDVEDLTVDTADDWVAAYEFDIDGSPAKVGAHGEVGNGGNHGDGCSDVVEDAVLAGLGDGKADKGKGRAGHDGADGPVPIGAMGSDGNGDRLAVDSVAWRSC